MRTYRGLIALSSSIIIAGSHAYGEPPMADTTVERLTRLVDLGVEEWSYKWGDFAGPERPDFDDADWEIVGTDYRWLPPDSRAWYRKWITIPEKIAGVDVGGSKVWLWMQFDDDGIVFVDGRRADQRNHAEGRVVVLAESAQPGQRVCVAIHNINNAVSGGLERAELHSDSSEPVVESIRRYLAARDQTRELAFAGRDRLVRDRALVESAALVDVAALEIGEIDAFVASLDRAVERLVEPLDIVRAKAEPQLVEATRLLSELDELLATARERGIDVSYPLVTRTTVYSFLTFARDDLGADVPLTVLRGAAIADQLIALCQRASAETRRLMDDDHYAETRRVPRYQSGDVEIRDGALYQDDRPIFLSGFGHFGQVRKDTPIFNDYGFNAIQFVFSPGGVVRSDGIDTMYIDALVRDLDLAAEHNVAVDLLIADSFPGWAYEQYPSLRVEQTGSLCFNIEHPLAREVLRRYLEAFIPIIADHPALFSICLTNEPSYTDDGPISEREFHRWLMEKHGSIGALNTRYGASYASVNDVPLPTREGAFDGDPPRPIWYDWCKYNQSRTCAHHRWMRDTIHEMAPELPVHVKIQGRVFDGQYPYSWGINPEDFTRIGRISGGDNYSYYRPGLHREYAQGWWRQAMFYDFQRSIAPEKPIFNSENHPIEDANAMWVSSDHMRTMLWQGAIHGQGASTTWVWERSNSWRQTGSLASNILTRPNCVDASGRASLDLMRLGDEIVALQQAPAQVAILFTSSSIPLNEQYLDESKNAYEGLYFLDTPVRFATDRTIAEGSLDGFRVLVAPGNTYIPDSTAQAVERFVREGGTLVLVGDALTHDEYGHVRDPDETQLLRARAQDTTWQLGSGRVVRLGTSLEPRQYADLLDKALDDADVAREIRVANHHQRRVWGVRTQSVRRDGGYLVYVVNMSSRPQTVKLIADEPLGAATDLLTGEPHGPLLELEPLVPFVLEIEKL